MAPNRRLAALSDVDRQELKAWLVDFGQQWSAHILPERARLPPTSSWRLPALGEMVKIDLERQWALGNRLSLETYLQEYPELGKPADVSADLIQAEYEVRNQFGAAADLDDYARRFPAQIEELRRLIASGRSSLSFRSKSTSNMKSATRRRAPADTAQELPEQFGRYRILKRLGAGGMGSVYLAEDTRLKRNVALKVAHISGSENRQVLERFYREATAAAALNHPYLCKVYDVGEIENVHYLTMQYIEGTTLGDFAASLKDRSQRQVAAIVGKLALALQEAHAKGVVHRDLKPANVMIKETGQKAPVIVNFGLAQHVNAGGMRLTQTGQAMGTPHYMSIEQVKGNLDAIGPACDIYALGVMLYELLTGAVPFDGPNPMVVIAQILTTKAAPPSTLRPDLDPKLEAICLKAMAREIKDRYSSMAEFAAALTAYLKAPASATSDPSPSAVYGVIGDDTSRTQGSDTLMGRFLDPRPAENAPAPIINPRPKAKRAVPRVPQSETRVEAKGPWIRWPMIAGLAAAFVALVLGVVIYVVTNKGRIKITVDGPKLAVKVDGGEVRLDDLDKPITLRAGEHEMTVIRGKIETETRKFVVRRGVTEDVRIEYDDASVPSGPVGQGSLKTITNVIGMKLTMIPAGEFLMGSPADDKDVLDPEKPQHKVLITKPFYLGVYEVTQGQYRAVTGGNPSGFAGSDDLPVEMVSWNDAIAFCTKLTESERQSGGLSAGWEYRLPTEAQWEYACRAGSTGKYFFGDNASQLDSYAWYKLNSNQQTHPVGGKSPNAFGLYDMYGNVFEWCGDWYGHYTNGPERDPIGPATGVNRARRGGGCGRDASRARSADRYWGAPNLRMVTLGFRVARIPSEELTGASPKALNPVNDPKGQISTAVGLGENAAADALQPGSVWSGKRTYQKGGYAGNTVAYELHVRARDGRKFQGHKFDNGPGRNRVELEGELAGTAITWTEHDSTSTLTFEGQLVGETIAFNFRGVYSNGVTNEGDGTVTRK